MLKNLLRIPDTFDPDDRRRRQVLNILLILFVLANLLGFTIELFTISCNCLNVPDIDSNGLRELLILDVANIILCGILLMANRSLRMPGWLSGTIFLTYFIIIITQTDTPEALYNGRSLIAWVVPIMLGTVI